MDSFLMEFSKRLHLVWYGALLEPICTASEFLFSQGGLR
jgi:hypothetical protein